MTTQTQKLKKEVKAIVGRATFGLRLHKLLLADSAVVVAFHRVNNMTVGDGLTCSVEMFKRYCSFFSKNFHVVSLRQITENMESGASPNGQLAITFDDGYRDNYEYAAPVLKVMGLPATFFVVTGFIGTDIVPWWDRELSIREQWMTWDQVRELQREGFEIGAHTRTHIDLGQVTEDVAREEILGSRTDLEEKLGVPVRLFAYPYGKAIHITEQARDVVRNGGFHCCCSCFGGVNSSHTDPFNLQRIPIGSWYESPGHFGGELVLRRV